MDLQKFGNQLYSLRSTAGYTQDQLIDALQSLAATGPTDAYRQLDGPLISRWERGSTKSKRKWKPTRAYMLHLITLFANQLTLETAQQWVLDCGYTLLPKELEALFPTNEAVIPAPVSQVPQQQPPLTDDYVSRTEFEQTIWAQLAQQQVVALTGLGGAGKSTLAIWAAHKVAIEQGIGVIWIDDCRYQDGSFHVFEAQERIARTLAVDLPNGALAERAAALRTLLHAQNYLIILDDVWSSDDLEHLRVQSPESPFMITTRSTAVAHRLGATTPITVGGMTPNQGRRLLGYPTDNTILGKEGSGSETLDTETVVGEKARDDLETLQQRVDHLPLALNLMKTLLQEGYTVAELLTYIQAEDSALAVLALEEQPYRATNLQACFDLSYHHLALPETQRRFAQLGCFTGAFSIAAASAVWGLSAAATRRTLDSLVRLSMVQHTAERYRLQRLLRDYAHQMMTTAWSEHIAPTQRRHSAFYLRHRLYHPQILHNVTAAPPPLNRSWLNVCEALRWAIDHAPELAVCATFLAHTERAVVLEMLGDPLIGAIQNQIAQSSDPAMRATLLEFCGDLHLLQQGHDAALASFGEAEVAWLAVGNHLASSRAKLRQAGVHLLQEKLNGAAMEMRAAQALLAQALPITTVDQPAARRLFYWFDLLYAALVRWEGLPQADVAQLADLAAQSGDAHLIARGIHIYRMWCTTPEIERSPEVRKLGRTLAEQAIQLWQTVGEEDKAEQEALWSEYQLNGRCPPAVAQRFATRLSQRTPQLNPEQRKVMPQAGLRWWLQTDETTRIAWLRAMLPRYLQATDSQEPALASTSEEWQWVRQIIGMVGSLRRDSRRLPLTSSQPPEGHFLNLPEWRVFSGQRALPLVDRESQRIVQQLLAALDAELVVTEE